ncbi:MAG TPA: YdbL family protein [Vitreimonas sp.]|uniref:YdbL family protein n=1 Tax=Vitreimonas sp. TaxID=3069702 RepID=UPI002D5B391D|nr:YdbL family protein [Vitreimonas sp.]HYD88967.1 YdbL family protein [Vitreimonas sp.]
MIRALAAAALTAATLALVAPAMAQDATLNQAVDAGLIGEQADGYLGFVPGANISATLRGRVEANNIQRRQLYTRRAAERNVSVNEMAAAVACEVFESRIGVGERYRDANGQWRQRTATQPVVMPPFCS